nr:hypothetical protein [Tanacetum cinerariifolium]
MSSLKLVDEPSVEDVSIEEPAYNEEEANLQRALELSLKKQAERTKGPAHPVVIREPDSGRIQPLLERRTPMPAEASGPVESPSLDAELALTDSEAESDDEVPKINTGDQDEGQAGPNPGIQDEGQAGPNPGIQDEGQAGPNPGVQDEGQAGSNPSDAAGSQPQPSHVENLKLPFEEQVIPKDPASSTGTLSSLQNLEKDLSFTDQFFVEKQQEEDLGKTNAEAEVQSMVSVPIHQDTSLVPLMTTPTIDLTSTPIIEEARQKKRKRRDVPRTPSGSPPPQPPPPPPPAGAYGAPGSEVPSSSKFAASAPYSMAWTTSDTRYELAGVDWTNPEGDQVKVNVNRPLPLGGPQGHVTIQSQFFFNNDLEYLRHGNKGSSPTLSISKMKAASYPDFGLELLVPEQMWIEDVCTYDISTKYGISYWWFNRQKFYIDRHDSSSHRKEVRSHMRILSVVRIKAYLRYGYDYLSGIVLRRADLQNYTIAEKDFKNLHPSDIEDLNLLLLQGYEFKHDYTIIESPRAVVFPVNNIERKIIRFNEIYKFIDGTLTWILEVLAYRVKVFKIKQLNPGMNMHFWTQNDVTRSKEFIAAIERRLKTRRIYQNLECFVGV